MDGSTYQHYTRGVGSMELYRDLCIEIDIIKVRIHELEQEYGFWLKSSFSSTRNNAFPLDTCLNRMERICDQVEEYSLLLDEKKTTKKEIEQRMSEFEGLERQVIYMREVERRPLKEIATKLGYSEVWIKKISSRIRKEYTKSILTS